MTTSEQSPAIELSGLTRRFGALVAVDGIDLTIERGAIVAMLGPNGAGKSTTTEIILGLQRADAGSVRVLGVDPLQAMRQGSVGAMLQHGALLDDISVRGLLRLVHGLHAHPLPVDVVVDLAGVGEFLRSPVAKLSGGQAQRVRLAMALLPDPELLLLDEPTVGLDVEARRGFWATMRALAERGRTIVFATHYLDEADAVADRVVVLAGGRIVADGTGAEIRRSVGGRLVSFRSDGVDWRAVPALADASERDGRVEVRTPDSDALLATLHAIGARDVEISSATLEDAFVDLVATAATSTATPTATTTDAAV